jgi:cytochrome c biogenesis protein CcdA
MVDDGRKNDQWTDFFRTESQLLRKTCLFPVLGDNDYMEGKGVHTEYFPVLENNYYSFEWGGAYFFGLFAYDSSGSQPENTYDTGSGQFKWLENELSRKEVSLAPFRIVFIHDPLIISRGSASEKLKRYLLPLFEKYNVDLVFSSEHFYERSNYNGITYIISGGAGAELIWREKRNNYSVAEARKNHYCRIDAGPNSLHLKAVSVDGTVFDQVLITPKLNSSGEEDSFKRLAKRLLREEITYNKKSEGDPFDITVFSTECSYCRKLTESYLPYMASKHGIEIKADIYSLADEGVYELFLNTEALMGENNSDVPAIVTGNVILGGENEIEKMFENEILSYKKDPKAYISGSIDPFSKKADKKDLKKKRFLELSEGVVFSAGFIDGINPCAFTTILLLVSYISISGFKRKKTIIAGLFYIAGVFITYFFVGVFFSTIFSSFVSYGFSKIINILVLITAAAFAILSLSDMMNIFRRKSDSAVLKLPKRLTEFLRTRIRNYSKSERNLMVSSFVLGCLISVTELVCTGQVYLPIIAMISEQDYRRTALGYLLIYNSAFIIPLFAVFTFSVLGFSSEKASSYFRRHIYLSKLLLFILFTLMSIIALYDLGWI